MEARHFRAWIAIRRSYVGADVPSRAAAGAVQAAVSRTQPALRADRAVSGRSVTHGSAGRDVRAYVESVLVSLSAPRSILPTGVRNYGCVPIGANSPIGGRLNHVQGRERGTAGAAGRGAARAGGD